MLSLGATPFYGVDDPSVGPTCKYMGINTGISKGILYLLSFSDYMETAFK